MKASSSILINVPIQEVFAFVATFENMDRWVSDVTEPRRITAGESEIRVGTEFFSKYNYRGVLHDITYIVTDYDQPTRYGMKTTSGKFPFESLIELESTSGGTKITNTIGAGADTKANRLIFALFGPLLRVLMRRHIFKELQVLKALLESNP